MTLSAGTGRPLPRPGAAVNSGAWWRTAVVYQVYIRSFADGNGDGIGDIAGIRAHLPYLARLGVDALWITPWYRSPMRDGGYDVADYRDIDPLFGTLAEADGLLADAHALGLRVLVDLVPNHTSDAHPWFQAALAAGPGSPERARYWFRAGRGDAGDEPPNGWRSVFGGPAWTRLPGDGSGTATWYLHLFDSTQPDLDWSNPAVRAEFRDIVAFWMDRGVDGIRVDVAHFLAKDPRLPDLADGEVPAPGEHPYEDREEVHAIYREWRRVADKRGGIFVGEINLPAERQARYLREGELHTAFNFDLAHRAWSAGPMRRSIDRTLASHRAVGAPATWVLGNHDLPRPTYRLGRMDRHQERIEPWSRTFPSNQVVGLARARAAALLTLALPGSAYIHQGEELGLPEVLDLPDAVRQDPTFHRTGGEEPGRDGDRVPFPWGGLAAPYGFGPEGSVPWLPQPASWARLSVEWQDQARGSTLRLYRDALALRRTHTGFAGETFTWLDDAGFDPDTLHFARAAGLRCLVNAGDVPVALPAGGRVLLRSDESAATSAPLPPDAAAWYTLD